MKLSIGVIALSLLSPLVSLSGCSWMSQQTPKSIFDAVQLACIVANVETDSKTVADLCHLSKDVEPLIEDVLSTYKVKAAAKVKVCK